MAELTDEQYYDDPSKWGQDQYITLENIIDNIMLTSGHDSYFKKLDRFKASIFGKQIIRKLKVDLKQSNKAIAIQLSPSKTFPFPRYMTNWHRISVLNDCKKAVPLNVNNTAQVQDYLQDNEWELLYDNNGEVLEGQSFNLEKGDCCVKFEKCEDSDCDCGCSEPKNCGCSDSSFSKSWVKVNKEGSYFEFSEDLIDEIIVIEFQTAGLEAIADCDVKVHIELEDTVSYYIKWKSLEAQRNVNQGQVEYHRREYKSANKRSENILGDKISIEQILDAVSLRYNN